jgi:hypothetical protein
MEHYSELLELISQYANFIANTVGHTSQSVLSGILDDDIRTIHSFILEVVKHFTVVGDEYKIFHMILDLDYVTGTYNTHIWCLANCVDRLASYANIPKHDKEAFFTTNFDMSRSSL